MTFKEFQNCVLFNTKLAVYEEDEFLGWYKLSQIIRCDDWIVDVFWAIDENKIGVRVVKE